MLECDVAKLSAVRSTVPNMEGRHSKFEVKRKKVWVMLARLVPKDIAEGGWGTA
jgi:hypothetical protein